MSDLDELAQAASETQSNARRSLPRRTRDRMGPRSFWLSVALAAWSLFMLIMAAVTTIQRPPTGAETWHPIVAAEAQADRELSAAMGVGCALAGWILIAVPLAVGIVICWGGGSRTRRH